MYLQPFARLIIIFSSYIDAVTTQSVGINFSGGGESSEKNINK